MHAFVRGLRPTLHISHRGGAALAPENTMAAFESAVSEHGTDMLEIDVHATRDGEIVVAHDATLERCTDADGPIADRTLAQLSRVDAGHRFTPDGGATWPWRGRGLRIPRLSDVLTAFPALRFNVEVKPEAPGVEVEVVDVVRRSGAAERVCIGSESDAVGARLLAAFPEACHFYPRQALTDAVLAIREGRAVPDSPFLVLDMPLHFFGTRLVDDAFLAAAAAAGKWVNVWTVDDPDDMRWCVEHRVGGVMTDRPDLLREVLGRRPATPAP
jgi:glycerophosphoryl diester phosphodiesterase